MINQGTKIVKLQVFYNIHQRDKTLRTLSQKNVEFHWQAHMFLGKTQYLCMCMEE